MRAPAGLMLTHVLLIFVLATIAGVAIAADRSRLPPAIVMVVVGLVLAVTPGLPRVGAHGKPVLFLHPKDFCGTLVEIEQA